MTEVLATAMPAASKLRPFPERRQRFGAETSTGRTISDALGSTLVAEVKFAKPGWKQRTGRDQTKSHFVAHRDRIARASSEKEPCALSALAKTTSAPVQLPVETSALAMRIRAE